MSDLGPLGQFLRSRRERLQPEEVGLRPNGRRRTPGLRREELATLAGVSVDYLVRLEQGRDTNPSSEVLGALADALRLGPEESRHLIGLAAHGASPALHQFCPATPALDADVPDTVRLLLDRLDPTVAFVVGPLGDVVAGNLAWHRLAEPLGLADEPNLVRHAFLHPEAPTVYVDWTEVADAQVARLRTAHQQLAGTPAFTALLEALMPIPAFAERWAAHPVTTNRRGTTRLRHPDAGLLHLTYEAMGLAADDQQLVAWLPADDATAATLDRLLTVAHPMSPAQLRVVGDASWG